MPRWIVGLALLLTLVACGAGSSTAPPTATPILLPGQNANTPCELAVVAMHSHPAHDERFLTLEANVFDSCPMIEFATFNDKVTEAYQYPDDGYGFVAHECRSPALEATRLCQTR